MTQYAVIAQKEPFAVKVETGKTYYWCNVASVKTNFSVMGLIRTPTWNPLPSPPSELRQFIFMAERKLHLRRSVKAHITPCKYGKRPYKLSPTYDPD